jgi:hypothetical protein
MRIIHAVAVVVIAMCSTIQAGTPKVSGDTNKSTLHGGVVSDPLWELDIPRQEIEPVLMQFVQAYEGGDVNRFMTLIAPQVRTEAGLLRAQTLREEYSETFLGTRLRRMILRNVHWTRTPEGVVADADFLSNNTSRRDDRAYERSGAARFHLTKQAKSWLISELYFSYDR